MGFKEKVDQNTYLETVLLFIVLWRDRRSVSEEKMCSLNNLVEGWNMKYPHYKWTSVPQ
jgi:hypothetical protein